MSAEIGRDEFRNLIGVFDRNLGECVGEKRDTRFLVWPNVLEKPPCFNHGKGKSLSWTPNVNMRIIQNAVSVFVNIQDVFVLDDFTFFEMTSITFGKVKPKMPYFTMFGIVLRFITPGVYALR
jgi:hypothetical protein